MLDTSVLASLLCSPAHADPCAPWSSSSPRDTARSGEGTLSDCSTSFRNSSAPAKGWDGPGPCVTSLDALLGSSALHFQGLRPAWLWWHRCHISSSTHLLPTHQIQGRDPAHATADSRKVTPLSMYETHSTFLQRLFC